LETKNATVKVTENEIVHVVFAYNSSKLDRSTKLTVHSLHIVEYILPVKIQIFK